MPVLDEAGLRRLRQRQADEMKICQTCTAQVWPNYCRECDQWFEDGHWSACASYSAHSRHRKY